MVFERLASVQTASQFTADWEAVNQRVQVANVVQVGIATFLWNRLQAAPLARVMAVWGMSWQTVSSCFENAPASKWSWTREEGGSTVRCVCNKPNLMIVQLSMLAKLPSSTQASEAAIFVDDAAGESRCFG